jgi:long-chain acyl-CoA synthetase
VARIEDTFGVVLQEVQIKPATTLAELEALLERQPVRTASGVQYPRWSLAPWASALRPVAIAILLRSWLQPFFRLRISGLEHLDALRGPALFMANHRSYLDSVVTSLALPKPIRTRLAIAASTEVLYRRFPWAVPWGELALNAFPFPTGADENIRPGLDYIGRLLDDGWNVLIFPEGQMNRTDQPLLELKGGTGLLASEMAVPIVPVAIRGSAEIMPPGRLFPERRATVDIRFGRFIEPVEGARADLLTLRVHDALQALLTT